MTARSTQLATESPVGTTASTVYTVPSGKRTIVKSVIAYNYGGAGTNLTLHVYSGSALLASMEIVLAALDADGGTKFVNTWFVMNAGQSLKAVCGNGTVRLLVSGAELNAI